jgi:hypothetical protein
MAALALIVQIDHGVAGWERNGKSTPDRLHLILGQRWRPQDCPVLDGFCTQLLAWTADVAELITPEARIHLEQPCPRCSAHFTHRTNSSGELIRSRALKVSETGAWCGECGGFWAPDEFHFLAKLLNCPELPT